MALIGLLSPVALSAQTTWDAPSFLRPNAPREVTVALTDNDPGGYLGALALWRSAPAPLGFGSRPRGPSASPRASATATPSASGW
jgi:hypothetical protein